MRLLLLVLLTLVLPAGEPSALFKRVLELQHTQEPELDDAAMIAAFTTLVESTRMALVGVDAVEDRITVINQRLLGDREVTYLSHQYWRDSTLAASLLRRQGNCLATVTLYVLVGEALNLPLKPVMVPGHTLTAGMTAPPAATSKPRRVANHTAMTTTSSASTPSIPPISPRSDGDARSTTMPSLPSWWNVPRNTEPAKAAWTMHRPCSKRPSACHQHAATACWRTSSCAPT